MIALPNLRHLKAFQAVARLGSVGQASASINISQPAVTQAIAKLEYQIGASVFDRRPTGSYPTEFGAILLHRVDRFFSMIEEGFSSIYRDARQVDHSPISQVTSTQIRSLVATADATTAAQSASAMGISRTALYRSARELEQILNCRLFQASAEGIINTPAGAELTRKVGLAIREIEYALEEVELAKGHAAARLSIGVLPMSTAGALSTAVGDLARKHPEVQITIREGTYLAMLNCLRLGQVDINFGLLRRPDWATDVVEESLCEDTYCVVARRDHPLNKIEKRGLEDFMKFEWIMPAPGTARRRVLEDFFEGEPKTSHPIETSSPSVIRGLLSNSNRISILSGQEVERDDWKGRFSTFTLQSHRKSVRGITTRANWIPTPIYREFLELLRLQLAVP
ncbi:MAG: LysR family transcriptional regulator [Phyllobacterium sp.]